MAKINRTVVRNQAYQANEFNIRERHNERKNDCYGNGDILSERSSLNIHFKQSNGTYEQIFNSMVENGEISLRGLQKNAKVFDEMIFDVNTAYFEENGGYEYAKQFFEEAYKLAVEEIGGKEYILSAVMHADERNKAESEKLGRDVFHYHLHVVYIPVVDKEVKWTKRCKNPSLVGTVKEVIKQVSHSKKWPRFKNKHGLVNSYSLLQDRFYEHMKSAGFTNFERGEFGSTAKHLTDLEYKTKKEKERVATLNGLIDTKKSQLESIAQQTAVVKDITTHYHDIDNMAKTTKFGRRVELSTEDWKSVSNLAKEGYLSRSKIKDLKENLQKTKRDRDIYKSRFQELKEKTKLFMAALELFPQKVMEFLTNLIKQPKLQQVQAISQKKRDYER